MNRSYCRILLVATICGSVGSAQDRIGAWMKYEKGFTSDRAYENPLYDVQEFAVQFTSPSGRVKKVNGFWDGGSDWKVRFCPDEKGTWTFETNCSDVQNKSLHAVGGSFECVASDSKLDLYTKGGIVRPKGCYYLMHADGTPFFFATCTAWDKCIDFPVSIQIGCLAEFMRTLPWWRLKPAPQLLAEQPGDKTFNHFISVSQADECGTIVVYVPVRFTVKLFNPPGREYEGEWFSPVANDTIGATLNHRDGVIEATPPRDSDMILVLHRR